MFLDYIEITNFRPYYGTQRIDFGFNEKENLTIILADNGSGKTSLVNALTWALYGKELHDVRDKSEPIYNLKAAEIAEAEGYDEINVEVKIRFYYFDADNHKKYFVVDREVKYQQWEDDQWSAELTSHLIVDETGKEPMDQDIAQNAINNKIPKNMFHYFFFNGATLSNYFESDSDLNLKNSIEQISQVGLVNSMADHLEKTLNNLNKQYDKLRPEGPVNYNKLINKKISERKDLEDERKANHIKIDEAQRLILELDEKLKKADSKHVKELTNRRSVLEKEKISLSTSIKTNTVKYENLILEIYPIAVLFDELIGAIEIADKSRETKTAPPLIERTLLNDILDDGYCICGVKLEDHPECVEELHKRLRKTTKVQTDEFYKDYYDIKSTLKKLENIHEIDNMRRTLEENNAHLIAVENEISEISEELISIDIADINEYEKHRDNNVKVKKRLRDRNTIIGKDIERLKNEIVQLKKKRDDIEEANEKLREINQKIEFCESAVDVVSTLNYDVQKHIRDKVTSKIRDQFIGIDWKYDKYTDVNIEDDYRIRVTKSSGQKIRPGDLSDGEENLLALSFMMALHSLSGFEIPLIIDAPLEKLDKSKRIDFISDLHEYTKDKQIIFLFTDSQYTNDVRASMLENVSEEYELKPAENKTEIVKHEQ
ncbi:AAA family ATPase [Methanobrevibacter millerae]|uniref:DNA sulfur modification protein DndD n=1 Tax=Methanobrevibacter millerae TaxID=230361 RepID=A0A1G5X4Y0_9EURY|nr:AAA family ATPase [Methanobrevibacter millerae]SDA65114.1 DNA sulfur modification protein DndD [Methanobrevibacter millerae]